MKQKKKYIKIFLPIIMVILICIGSLLKYYLANAAIYVDYDSTYATWNVEVEGTNIIIHNYDQTRSGSIYYKTIGFTISRCEVDQQRLHNGTASDWVALDLLDVTYDEEKVITTDNKYFTHTKWVIPVTSIYGEIVRLGFNEWADEFKAYYLDKTNTSSVIYLKFDSIMVIVTTSDAFPEGLESGEYDPRNRCVLDGTCYTNTPLESALPENQKNPYVLRNAKGWRNKDNIDYHYNRYLYLHSEDAPAGIDPSGFGLSSGSLYETKNYSPTYNVSKAIPSGERVTNSVSVSVANGDITVNTVTEIKDYTVTYSFKRKVPKKKTIYKNVGAGNGNFNPDDKGGYTFVGDKNGSYIMSSENTGEFENVDAGSATYTFRASVKYQYISSINLQAIESVTVKNNAFPGGQITYSKSELNNSDFKACMVLRSQDAASKGLEYDTLVSGTDLTGYNFAPNNTHYSFPVIGNNTKIIGESDDLDTAKSQAFAEIRAILANGCKSSNDAITIYDNGTPIILMEAVECIGCEVTSGSNTWNYGTVAASSSYSYGANGTTASSYITGLNANRAIATKTVTIPPTTQNSDYPTGMQVTYKSIYGPATTTTMSAGKNFGYGDSIYNHVMAGGVLSEHNGGDPDDGYPIRVHTPIVAPFEIVFNDLTPAVEDTQLVSTQYNSSSNYQLLLDRSYYIKWDNELWYSNVYGDVSYGDVFDRYVAKKEVRFPFSVVYNGKYYPLTASGYTVWIEVERPDDYTDPWDYSVDVSNYESFNHWQMTPFYVPSIAEEGGYPGNNKFVEVAVYAYNYTGASFSDDDETAVDINTSNSSASDYIATTRKQIQLSGWIYDFTIVGTTNQALYTGSGLLSNNIYDKLKALPLAALKSELKTGVTNRLGTNNIRYLSDGSVNNAWEPLQTTPMQNGQSFAFTNLGQIWKGQTFAYTIKTISNLNGNNDFIRITPSFKYINEAGEVLSSTAGECKLYQVSGNRIKEFNPTDTSISGGNYVKLSNDIFTESFYDDSDSFNPSQIGNWVETSANKENSNNSALGYIATITEAEYMNREILSYNFDSIYIPDYLRYMAGEYEQLQMNDGKSYNRATGSTSIKTYNTTITNYSSALEDKFKCSMQQWQSCYVVPSNVCIIDTRLKGGSTFDIYSFINSQDQFSFEKSPDVIKDKGQLIIGFDIIAYRNGIPYLQYEGINNMWARESSLDNPPVSKKDVAIVDLSKSVTNYYEPAIQNIN